MGWKLWNTHSHVEIVDNIIDSSTKTAGADVP